MNENGKMLCPGCKSELIIDGDFTYEDCCESESWSNKHICDNDKCYLYRKTFWNDYGDYFSGDLEFSGFEKHYGHNKYAAFNSFAKNSETSIYKKGLRDKYYLSPALTLWWLKPFIEFEYTADDMGNVLKTRYKLGFLKKEKGADGYYVYYSSPIKMFFWSINYFKKKLIHYRKNPTNRYAIYEVIDDLDVGSWDKRIWKRLSRKWLKIRYKKILKEVKKKYDFLKIIEHGPFYNLTKYDYDNFSKKCPSDFNLFDTLLEFNYRGDFIEKLKRKRKFENILKNINN